MRKFDVRIHVTQKLQAIVVSYPPCGFNEYNNNTYGDNSNSNCNDSNNNDNSNGNTDNKYKNINNDNVHFCNS